MIRANNLLQFIHQVTIEIRFRKSLAQERFKSNLEFRNHRNLEFSLHMSKCHIFGNHMSWLLYTSSSAGQVSMGVDLRLLRICKIYCKSGNFRESFIFANSVKRNICYVKYSRLGHDLPISVTTELFRNFARILFSRYFVYAKFRENTPSRKFPNLQYQNLR